MGLCTDHYTLHYMGNSIEVEARVAGLHGKAQYDLIVNNRKFDQIEGTHGTFFLRGEVPGQDGTPEPIKVEVSQGIFGAKYFLCVGNQRLPMQKA
jgi:hypothetical protein